jgi:hypothetical protein
MEHRRRTVSNVLDEDIIDIEKQTSRRRCTSTSIEDSVDEHTEYVYNGTFRGFNTIWCGLLKLICPCFAFCTRKRAPITVSD